MYNTAKSYGLTLGWCKEDSRCLLKVGLVFFR